MEPMGSSIMPARNLTKWNAVPGKLEDGEYVDSRIYSDEDIFNRELKTIFSTGRHHKLLLIKILFLLRDIFSSLFL